MRRLRLFVLLFSLGFAGAATAQGPAAPAPSELRAEPALAQATQPAGIGQPPRTLRAYWHVFIAFAVTWLLLFGYALSLGRRWAALEREVLARQ